MKFSKATLVSSMVLALAACGGGDDDGPSLNNLIEESAGSAGVDAYMLPESDDFANIPQDPNNPITAEKVALGQMLYHETAIATAGVSDRVGTWSCASCHHAAAGFKSGIPQGIAEGGEGFGFTGESRVLVDGFAIDAEDPALVPDIQPFTSPAVLNTAYQEVMLWNGQFGNQANGVINTGLTDQVLATPGTPKQKNELGFGGLEIQAVAGTGVHRLKTDTDSVLQTNTDYIAMFDAAFPNGPGDFPGETNETTVAAGLAMATYERTILANQAPFQRYLRGENDAMNAQEVRGAKLFFGDAGCADCHRGPGLSSEVGAVEDEVFMAIGFADFDLTDDQIHSTPNNTETLGRGGFTGEEADNYKFKIPQLYNLADTDIFGHGASFRSIRDVIAYKNAAVPQKIIPDSQLDPRFVPLGLSEEEIDDLTVFLETALYDPNLNRYVPTALPTTNCFPVNDAEAQEDLACN